MFKLNENEKEYRFGDSGPKYLMKGPRLNFAVVQFQPGQDFPAHYHNIMEENFYIMEGEIHYVKNNSDKKIVMISTLGPFQDSDKVEVKDFKWPQ